MGPFSGAFSGTFQGGGYSSCGYSYSPDPAEPRRMGAEVVGGGWVWEMTFVPDAPFAPWSLAPLTVALILDASFPPTDSSVGAEWATPSTCTLTVTSDDCVTGSALLGLHVIRGTGTCPDPALPTTANATGHLTIGDFAFTLQYIAAPAALDQ
jgi:hypothetical protein